MADDVSGSVSGSGEFSGKSVIVTGAASGLGRETALGFARAGADLTIADVNEGGLAETAGTIRALGGRVEAVTIDLTRTETCATLVERSIGSYGRLDALCNVAGAIRFNALAKVTTAEWDLVMGVNLKAPFFLIQAAMPHLIATEGAVVSVASASAFFGHAFMVPYAASKAALVSLTKSLAMEFIHTPVRINALAPGAMATPMSLESHMPSEDMDFSLVARYSGLREMGQAADVVEIILFLASQRAKAVHGTCFVADRGISAG